jgi:hypothetical protein
MAPLRYLLFAVVGVAIASVLFLVMNFLVSANFEAGVNVVERWIVRAMCDRYQLAGTVRGTDGRPVPFAVVEVSYRDERLTTRSNTDGTFRLAAAEAECNRRPPARVELLVIADDFRPRRQSVPFEAGSVEVKLDARDFRP